MRIIVLASLILLLVVIFPFFYKTSEVRCVSQYGECSESVRSKIERLSGQPIKQIESEAREIISKEPSIEKYNLIYIPLSKFKIELLEKKAEVAVREKNSEKLFLLTKDGQFLSEAQESSLPKIFIENENISFHDPEVKFAAILLTEVYKYYSIDSFIVDESSIVGIYNKKIKLTFPLQGDIDVILGSLELLLFQLNDKLQQSKIEDVKNFSVTEIDLRYKNPVVR